MTEDRFAPLYKELMSRIGLGVEHISLNVGELRDLFNERDYLFGERDTARFERDCAERVLRVEREALRRVKAERDQLRRELGEALLRAVELGVELDRLRMAVHQYGTITSQSNSGA